MVSITSLAFILAVVATFSCTSAVKAPPVPPLSNTARVSIPVYGNWCGPGHGGTIKNDKPCIDSIDCACRAHDLCYERYGFLNCECDNEMVKDLKGKTNPLAVLMRDYFADSICREPQKTVKWCRKCTKRIIKICSPYYPCGSKCHRPFVFAFKSLHKKKRC